MARRRLALAATAAMGAAAVMGAASVAAAGPASAASPGASCARHERVSTSITGITENKTGLTLKRTYLEKGALNTWGDEPAWLISPHKDDGWCSYADYFGTAMKVVYDIGNGSHVTFEAWRYREGPVGSRCSVEGPEAAAYRCTTHITDTNTRRILVWFALRPMR